MVSIAVQLFKAMEDEKVELHLLHKVCGSRIQYRKHCPVCHMEVDASEVVRGAELPDGRYVVVESEAAGPAPDHTIAIVSFHDLPEIDPVLYRQAYWVKPLAGAEKAYRLLAETLQDTHLVALATMALRQKFSLAVVRSMEPHVLMLHSLYFPESLREDGRDFGQGQAAISDKERDMAKMLVMQMQEPFVAANYPNEARRELLERIQAGSPQGVHAPDEAVTKEVLSLMEQLRASVEQTAHPRQA